MIAKNLTGIDGENYSDSVGTERTRYYYPDEREKLTITNKGTANITLVVDRTTYTIAPNQAQSIIEPLTSFSLEAVTGTQAFTADAVSRFNPSIRPLLKDHEAASHRINAAGLLGAKQQKETLTIWESGHGWVKTSPAGSTISDDAVNFRTGLQGLKLTATTQVCFAEKAINSNVLDKDIEVDVYVLDETKVATLDILMDVSGNFTSYFATAVSGSTLKAGWNTIGFDPRRFALLGTNPPTFDKLANIKKWRVKVANVGGQEAVVTFDRIQLVPRTMNRGKVTLTFDDGHDTVFSEAKWRMDKYGFRGVAYVITSQHDGVTANRMTMNQLKTLDALGWDIACHTKNHTYLIADNPTPQQITEQLLSSKQWLIKNGFYRGSQHLATPGGQFTPAILDEIKQYFSTHRTVMESHEYYPPADPYRLRIRNVVNTTTVATVQSWIDSAAQNKEWLILTFHYFMSPADTGTKVLPADFQAMMDYLATADVDVLTMSEMVSHNPVHLDTEKGFVLKDRTTGALGRMKLDNGVLSVEPI